MHLGYAPKPSTYGFYDTISIVTSQTNFVYKVICEGYCAHVDRTNVARTKNLKLSKSKDLFLFLRGCGSQTNFTISDEDGKAKKYSSEDGRIIRVNLDEYPAGVYSLEVTMNDCDLEGDINLNIEE